MQKTSGYQPKTGQELSVMNRAQLLARLTEIKLGLDEHYSVYKKVFAAMNEAQSQQDMANEVKIAATKSVNDFLMKHGDNDKVSMQTKMEAARLKGIESFAVDTYLRAKEDFAQKKQDHIDIMEEGFAIAAEIALIDKVVSILEEKEREAATFNNPLVHNHMTHNN